MSVAGDETSPPRPPDPSAVEISAADFFFCAAWPDLEGKGCAVMDLSSASSARRASGASSVARSPRRRSAPLPPPARGPADIARRWCGRSHERRRGAGRRGGSKPIDSVGLFDGHAMACCDVERGAGARQTILLIRPDVGKHAPTVSGIGGIDGREIAAGALQHRDARLGRVFPMPIRRDLDGGGGIAPGEVAKAIAIAVPLQI